MNIAEENINIDGFKFRGMDLSGDWHIGNLAILKVPASPNVKPGYYISNKVGMPFAYAVRPETIGRCTGHKDEKGNFVFEGDIIYCHFPDSPVHGKSLISYLDESCRFVMAPSPKFIKTLFEENIKSSVVVGNMFQNPDMLNEIMLKKEIE